MANETKYLLIPACSIVLRNRGPCNLKEHAATTTRSIFFSFNSSVSSFNPDSEHKYNLPEGVGYEYEGEGLIPAKPENRQTPFSDNPLERLNRGVQ